MPTSTIIIVAALATLILWTAYHLLKDLIRKLSKRSDICGRSDEIRDTIEVEREKDRQRMGSMFATSSPPRPKSDGGDSA